MTTFPKLKISVTAARDALILRAALEGRLAKLAGTAAMRTAYEEDALKAVAAAAELTKKNYVPAAEYLETLASKIKKQWAEKDRLHDIEFLMKDLDEADKFTTKQIAYYQNLAKFLRKKIPKH